jgi:hypothetical protein
MNAWEIGGELFQLGIALDPRGFGAGWARIAVAARTTRPADAFECARRAVETNPAAWRPWFAAFMAASREVAA